MSEAGEVKPVQFVWTEDRVRLLERRHKQGASYGDMADELGVTRSAIAGKLKRLGLQCNWAWSYEWTDEQIAELRERAARHESCVFISRAINIPYDVVRHKAARLNIPIGRFPRVKASHKPPPSPSLVKSGKGFVLKQEKIGHLAPDSLLDPAAIPLAQRKTFFELEQCHCRFPFGHPGTEQFFFCGADRHGEEPYCYQHLWIAKTTREQRQREYQERQLMRLEAIA